MAWFQTLRTVIRWRSCENQKLFFFLISFFELWPLRSLLLPRSAHLLHLCYCYALDAATPPPVHLSCFRAMTEDFETCDLTCSSPSGDPEETLKVKSWSMECEQPIFSALGGGMKLQKTVDAPRPTMSGSPGKTSLAAATSDTESGIYSVESELCVDHESELDWFCGTEQKLICSHCATVGSCQGHTVTPLATRVTRVRVSLGQPSNSCFNIFHS